MANALTSGQAATAVLGQSNLTSGSSAITSASDLSIPTGVAVDSSGNVWVVDIVNNRVLEYTAPITNGEGASIVLGQPDFTSNSPGLTANTLSEPQGIAIDSSGNVWVADNGNNRVLEYLKGSGFTNGEAATRVLGQPDFISNGPVLSAIGMAGPNGVALDSLGNVWVADGQHNRVLEYAAPITNGEGASIVLGQSGFTSSSPATTDAGLSLPVGLATDTSGNVWVTDYNNNRVLEYLEGSGFTDGQSASLVLGQSSFTTGNPGTTASTMNGPEGVAVSSGNIWVADASNNRAIGFTTAILAPTNTAVTCTASLTIDVSSSTICAATVTGQSGSITGETVTWSQTAGPGAVSFSSSTCNLVGSPETCSVTVTGVTAGSATAQASYPGDSSNGPSSNTAVITVNAALGAPTVVPSATTMDNGQTISATVSWTGGTSEYTATLYSSSTGTCSSSSILVSSQTPLAASPATFTGLMPTSTLYYCATVSDSASTPVIATSAAVQVTVNPVLVAGAITPASPSINDGSSVTLTANPSGGTTSYTYQWYTGIGCTASIPSATGSTYLAAPTSTSTFYYQVTDSSGAGAVFQCSAGDLVTVTVGGSPLAAGLITPSSPSIDHGQSVTLTSNPSGGTPAYTYQWYAAANCASQLIEDAASTLVASPSSTTTFSYSVTDSAGTPATECSLGDTVTVNSALNVGVITPSSPSIALGQSVTLTANPSGGTTPYSYQWYTGAGCTLPASSATGSTYSPSPSSTTTYYVLVTDSSATAESGCSSADTVTVNPALTAGAITPSNPSIILGQSVTLTAHPAGGTTPYSYQWYTGANCIVQVSEATQSTYSPSPSSTTPYSYKVTDSAFAHATACSAVDTVTVNAAIPSIILSPSSAPPGSQVQVSGSGFSSLSLMTIRFAGTPIATTPSSCVSDIEGAFSCGFTVPSSASPNNYAVSATDGINVVPAILSVASPIIAVPPANCEDSTPCYTSFVVFSTGQGGVKVSVSSAVAPMQVGYTNSQNLATGVCALASGNLSAWGCLVGETGQFTTVVNSTVHYTVTYQDGTVVQGNYAVHGAWIVSIITVTEQHSGSASAARTILMGSSPQISLGTPGTAERLGGGFAPGALAGVLQLQSRLESEQT